MAQTPQRQPARSTPCRQTCSGEEEQEEEDIIVVDCGIKFLNGSNLADGTVPNFSYLLANQKKIKGLFITHGHEDHIGGIPYLLKLN